MIPEGNILIQLFGWTRFNALKPLFIEMGADEDINIRYQDLQDYLSNKSSGTKQ